LHFSNKPDNEGKETTFELDIIGTKHPEKNKWVITNGRNHIVEYLSDTFIEGTLKDPRIYPMKFNIHEVEEDVVVTPPDVGQTTLKVTPEFPSWFGSTIMIVFLFITVILFSKYRMKRTSLFQNGWN